MHSWPSAASTPTGSSQAAWDQDHWAQGVKPSITVTSPPATAEPTAK